MTAFKCARCPQDDPRKFYWDRRRDRPFKRCVDCWNATRRTKRQERNRTPQLKAVPMIGFVPSATTIRRRGVEPHNQKAGPLEAVEAELFPGVPYHQLTAAQRDIAANVCKQRLGIPT